VFTFLYGVVQNVVFWAPVVCGWVSGYRAYVGKWCLRIAEFKDYVHFWHWPDGRKLFLLKITLSQSRRPQLQEKRVFVCYGFLKVLPTALQIRRSLVRSQMVSLEFFIDINPSDCTMALGSTQLLTEMSTRSISWG
jgi:hypothetical protein